MTLVRHLEKMDIYIHQYVQEHNDKNRNFSITWKDSKYFFNHKIKSIAQTFRVYFCFSMKIKKANMGHAEALGFSIQHGCLVHKNGNSSGNKVSMHTSVGLYLMTNFYGAFMITNRSISNLDPCGLIIKASLVSEQTQESIVVFNYCNHCKVHKQVSF